MNFSPQLRNDMQYSFFIHSVRKSKRFSPWDKKTKDSDLDLVKKYYGYNTDKAQAALKILTQDQIKIMASKLNTGGKKSARRSQSQLLLNSCCFLIRITRKISAL